MMWVLVVSCLLMGTALGEPQCPSQGEIKKFAKSLDGELVLPGSLDYVNATEMLQNPIFDSLFSFVLYAKSIGDVQKYVKFARRYDLRPTIRSSGHDYIGRSAGKNTYHISFQKFREVSTNKNDPDSDTGASMTMTTGNPFKDLYKRAHDDGYIITAGSAHTVTPGGYLQGGGHSPMTRMLGLGVDSLLHITMVTVDGDIMEINKTGYILIKEDGSQQWTADPTVFWALCGGGGGVFGFVVKYKIKMHREPPNGVINMGIKFPMVHPLYGDITEQVITKFNDVILNGLTNNWGGFLLTNNLPDSYGEFKWVGQLQLFMLHYGGDMAEANKLIQPLFSWKPEWVLYNFTQHYPSFWDYEQTVSDESRVRTYIVNRLVQADDLRENTKIVDMFKATLELNQYAGCTGTLVGGDHTDTTFSSVNPAVRSARMALTCATAWENPSEDRAMIQSYREFALKYMYPFGRGVYYNEPDYFLEDWKTEYWGSMDNYDKLLSVKKKLDPGNVLCCHHCVGSDLTECDTPCPWTSGASRSSTKSSLLLFLFCAFWIVLMK